MNKKFWTPTSGIVSLCVILGWIRYLTERAQSVAWSPEAVMEGDVGHLSYVTYTFNGRVFSMAIERVA